MSNKAYVLPDELNNIVVKMKKELGYKEDGQVIARALELLNYSIGRKVILEEKNSKKSIQIDDLENHKHTFEI